MRQTYNIENKCHYDNYIANKKASLKVPKILKDPYFYVILVVPI